MHKISDVLARGTGNPYDRVDPSKRGPGGLPLWLVTPDGRVGRVIGHRPTAARLQFETRVEVAPGYPYKRTEFSDAWFPLRKLRPART